VKHPFFFCLLISETGANLSSKVVVGRGVQIRTVVLVAEMNQVVFRLRIGCSLEYIEEAVQVAKDRYYLTEHNME
jgi:thymidine phosphorylase